MSALLELGGARTRAHKSIALLAFVAILSLRCGREKDGAQQQATETGPAVAVVVAPVVQKTVPIYTELTARTDATNSVDIRARVKAFLKTQNYTEGSLVKAGQVLFTLDDREYEAQLMHAKAQLAKGEADLAQAEEKTVVDTAQANVGIAIAQLNKTDQDVKRLKPLADIKAVPQQDYDNALAAQQAARADLEGKKASLNTAKVNQAASIELAQAEIAAANAGMRQAQLNIEYCTVRTPIDGIAGIRQVGPGNLVGQNEATLLTTVSKIDPMRVYISISESEYLNYQRLRSEGKLRPGLSNLELILSDGSTFPEKGRLIIADRAVDLKTGTLNLVAAFPNPKALLRPGQFGRVRFAASVAENASLVPQKAVTEMQSAKIVYVVNKDNKVALRTVTLGDRAGPDYIVKEGVKPGERVVVEGIQKVRPGATVVASSQPLTSEKGSAAREQ
jgi:membrane fusion protein (multidrug efflux system)